MSSDAGSLAAREAAVGDGLRKLLIANRGEIAARIARTAAEMGLATVSVHARDDAACLHARRTDETAALPGQGARAYLDADALVRAAVESGADAVHPGYGFLSENVDFARKVEAAGLVWVGPTPDSLALFGDKTAAKRRAQELGVPTIPGTAEPTSLEAARDFFDALPEGASMMIKAVAGGGGRGMRAVSAREEVEAAWDAARREAKAAFGDESVYVERFLPAARHLEVQILGDGTGACIHLHERECTLQRRNQKLVEVAPSPALTPAQRERLTGWALEMARSGDYRSLGTFEFMQALDAAEGEDLFFIEANPRIQVEHTVTEEVLDLDLVRLQLDIASGATLADLGLTQDAVPAPRGYAVQTRVNMEKMDAAGNARPAGGTVSVYEPPSGPGIRVDGFAYAGYRTSAHYDSLFAKVIVHARGADYGQAVAKAARALSEFRLEGVETNLPWLRALLSHPQVRANEVTTRFIEAEAPALHDAAATMTPPLAAGPAPEAGAAPEAAAVPEDALAIAAPMQATVVALSVAPGERVRAGQQLAVLEAMKMEHVVAAPQAGVIRQALTEPGRTLMEGEPIFALDPVEGGEAEAETQEDIDLDRIRPDLQELRDRLARGLDENRPEAVAKRRARGHQTARENLGQLCDPGTFAEYGALALAAQRARRSLDDLIANTTGDGIVTGIGSINGDLFPPDRARCAFAVYDYMVLAATQGQRNHKKQDRLFGLAGEWRLPVVLLAEGGGGRPGDTERTTVAGLDNKTFSKFASLSGQVPLVGVVSGRCFAGNAALLGCCDVIIADESANIGMAGPAMIEGGGLGVYKPEEIGPIDVQSQGGVVDIRVKDEAEACAAAKKYISYFQGDLPDWSAADQRLLRRAIPENRLRVHEVRDVIETMADEGSVLELRREFGVGIVTAFIRIEGRPFGLIANNSRHLGGAIDAPAADKASRFMQLCDAFGIPMISLCDTPGFMVGPQAEATGLVRHVCRMFVTAASLSVPIFGVVLRKGYGLGAQAMLGGGFHDSFFTVSWPTGEFGGMGLEGAVQLGYRRELEAEPDPEAKQALFDRLLAEFYEKGKAISVATCLEIDAVIDPMDTRSWILRGLSAIPPREPMNGGRRAFIDTW
jgi:acetyl/propionyl-CoA carboxylase alpha subunit/acetyl-CoA carboxylase carboxyltransferase component